MGQMCRGGRSVWTDDQSAQLRHMLTKHTQYAKLHPVLTSVTSYRTYCRFVLNLVIDARAVL